MHTCTYCGKEIESEYHATLTDIDGTFCMECAINLQRAMLDLFRVQQNADFDYPLRPLMKGAK